MGDPPPDAERTITTISAAHILDVRRDAVRALARKHGFGQLVPGRHAPIRVFTTGELERMRTLFTHPPPKHGSWRPSGETGDQP